MVESVTNDWMETITGRMFTPFSISPHYTLKDLIWGCARETRFNGQYSEDLEFYSVAEHQVLLTDWVRTRWPTWSLKDLRTVAMHDAQEGLLKDIVRPVKRLSPEYRKLEDWMCTHLARRFDLWYPLPAWIKELDNRILVDEYHQAVKATNHWPSLDGLEALKVHIRGWTPRQAAGEYTELLKRVGIVNA